MLQNTCTHSFETLCEFIQSFATCVDDYLYVFDMLNDEYYISERAMKRFAIGTNRFKDATKEFGKFVYPEDADTLAADLDEIIKGKKTDHNIQYRWMGKNNEPIWIDCRGQVLMGEDGRARYLVGCVNEIGRKPIADNLSGFYEAGAIAETIGKDLIDRKNGYILRIGIDDFKEINERLGMDYGDYVLKGVAGCVRNSLRSGQTAYRLPADEFLIIDFVYGTAEEAKQLYHQIRNALDDFVEENRYEAVYTISGGVVTWDCLDNPTYQEIMKISQFALSEAKKRGKNQVYVFNDEDYNRFVRMRNVRKELRKSVGNNCEGFQLFFQPIVSAKTGELYAAESLLRFHLSNGEMVSPVEFIPILEDTGLIIPVGKWILNKAIEMCKIVRKIFPKFRVSVNLSYIQILKSSITDEIYQQVGDSGLDPDSMIMELTESGYLEDTQAVRRVWTHLKDFGVSIALDDFGTGYSNLQSIGNLTPNVVKLDRGFTIKALQNDYENLVMRYVIEMVHSLNLKICVEGIETQEELDKIKLLSPDYIQGFYYGRPCSKEDFLKKYVYVD